MSVPTPALGLASTPATAGASSGPSASATATRAYLLTETGTQIPFQFNPAEITIVKRTTWQAKEAKGKNAPQQRFQSGQPATMNLSIVVDSTTSGAPVTTVTDQLLELVMVQSTGTAADQTAQAARPPLVTFVWGITSFRAVVEQLTIKYTLFARNGKPLRAKCDLSLKQFDDDEVLQQRQNPTSGTPHPHAVHHLRPGESLDRVAAQHYKDPTAWRRIAEANGIDDPTRLRGGTPLVMPELPWAGRG